MNISELSIKRSTIPMVVFLLLALGGIFSYSLLNKELIPSMDVPVSVVMTVYPGAAPSEVENSVTKPVEEAASALEGIDNINAYSFEGLSLVIVQYKSTVNSNIALQECERKVNMIKNTFPENSKDPQFMKFDINMFPIMSIAVKSNISGKEFFDILDKEIKPKLSQIKGIAKVDIIGGDQREIEIKANAEKLNQYGISLLRVKMAIEAANIDFPTGKIKDDQNKFIVRIAGKVTSLDQMRDLVVGAAHDGSIVKLCDIATVVDGTKKAVKLARINGESAVGIDIQKQTDGNAVEISKEVRKQMLLFEKQFSDKNLKFIVASDNSEFTEEAVNGVMRDLLFAIVLVSITMLLFLHTFRNLLFIFISIPTSIISTIVFFKIFGFSLNLLTLLALSIVVGAIVDDAIVVLENIYRHLEMGKTRLQASLDATKELGLTVFSITIVLIAVFLPIGLISGTIGNLLRSFSMVIVISILLSLLVSFTLVPMLTARFGKLKVFDKKRPFDRFLLGFESIITNVKILVLSALKWTLKHKVITLIIAGALFFGSFFLVSGGYIQSSFMDTGDRGEFLLSIELDRSTTLEKTASTCILVEKKLLDYPEIKSIYTKVGSKGGSVSILETPYAAEFVIKLVPKDKRELSTRLFSKKLQNDLGSTFADPKFIIEEINSLGSIQTPIQIYATGKNYEEVMKYSQVVAKELREIKGTTDVTSSMENGDKEMVVKFDREKLAKLGLTIGEVGAQMYISFEGNRDLKYRDANNEYDLFISLDEFDRKSKSDIENMSFVNHSQQLIKLSQVASIEQGLSPAILTRYNKFPSVRISSNLVGKTVGTVGTEIKSRLAKIDKPAGVDVIYSGDMANQSDAFSALLVALAASILFMYFTMVLLYDNYIYPLVVMLSLPLSIIGALLALALAGKSLSLFSIMGIIMLMGLVAKNAILVVDFANTLQKGGKTPVDAVTEATNVRFRPILMTNLALIVGLLPIALSSGAGAEWKNGLGWVLIGGLSSSMVLSMIIVPVLYVVLDRINGKKKPVVNNTEDAVYTNSVQHV